MTSVFRVAVSLPARVWLRLLGLMASTIHVLPNARLRMRQVQIYFLSQWSSLRDPVDKRIIVPFSLSDSIRWWSDPVQLSQPSQLSPQQHTHVLTTDASVTGWGGVLDDVQVVRGRWTPLQAQWHINCLELTAVEFSLRHFLPSLRGKVVLVRSDNTTTCAYINRQGGTRSSHLCAIACRLWNWCLDQDILIRAAYIPGVVNIPADSLSRGKSLSLAAQPVLDQREWSLSRPVAQAVFLLLGEPQIDLFATKANTQLPVFCSLTPGTGALAVDSLTLPWSGFLGYAFPPPTLLTRVLNKVLKDQASLVLVAPRWPDRPWFTTLLRLLVQPPVALPPVQDLLSQLGSYHHNPEFFKLTAWRISGDPSLSRDFRRRLSTQQSVPGGKALGPPTSLSGLPSGIGVVKGVSIPLLSL